MASAIAESASLLHKAISSVFMKEQDITIMSLLKVKGVLAVLPTGFGKSLVFQVFFLKWQCPCSLSSQENHI